jgi:hypothetical protein
MIKSIVKALQRWVASAERDRISEKFDDMDTRIDRLELGQTEMKSDMKSIHEVGLANLELLEQKINNGKTGLEMLKDYMKDKFEDSNKTLNRLEGLITETFRQKD